MSFLRPRPERPAPCSFGGSAPVVCPECESPLVQPQGWKELPHGALLIHLRCPECEVRVSDTFDGRLAAEFDRALLDARKAIKAGYERIVRQNMAELAEGFSTALELDLIGADDFGVTRPAGCSAR